MFIKTIRNKEFEFNIKNSMVCCSRFLFNILKAVYNFWVVLLRQMKQKESEELFSFLMQINIS